MLPNATYLTRNGSSRISPVAYFVFAFGRTNTRLLSLRDLVVPLIELQPFILQFPHQIFNICLRVRLQINTSAPTKSTRSWEADISGGGLEIRSRLYLVLVEKPSHISLSAGFMLSVLRPISSISRVPGAGRHSSRQRLSGVRMPERARDAWLDRRRAYLCNFLGLFLVLDFITAAPFSPPAARKWLEPTRAPFKPHYLHYVITESPL